MENNNEQTNINELIKDIDNKIEEVTSDPSYDEKEGKEQEVYKIWLEKQ